MIVREHVDAGQCYPADADGCRSALLALHESARVDAREATETLPKLANLVGGLIPHGQWSSCARTSACVLEMLASARSPDVVVMFGGASRTRGKQAALFGGGRWTTPIGRITVAARLAERVLSQTNLVVDDPYAHESEDSLEVQMPLIQQLFSAATVLPIIVPNNDIATEIGKAIGRTLNAYAYDAVVVGTANIPRDDGAGNTLIESACTMCADEISHEQAKRARPYHSGAAAATIATCAALGATAGVPIHELENDGCPMDGNAECDSTSRTGMVFV